MKKDVHNFVNNVFYDTDGYYQYKRLRKAPYIRKIRLVDVLKAVKEEKYFENGGLFLNGVDTKYLVILEFYDIETPEKYEIFKQNIIDFIEFYSDSTFSSREWTRIGPLALQERLGYELGLEPRTKFLRELCGVMGIPLNTFTNTSM